MTFTQTPEGVLVRVHCVPGAKGFAVEGINEWTGELRVRVPAEAEKGRANEELVSRLGKVLGTDVKIIKGMKSHKKTLLVKGKDISSIRSSLRLP
ncbi:MAG: YggU family protein [Candidatus Diapherotrites archaeon]|nr:YggU family protein [Candidatus Diapherotrites archaeon]